MGVAIGIGLLIALTATVGPLPPPSGAHGASLEIWLPGGVRMVVLTLCGLSVLLLFAIQRRPRPVAEEPPTVQARRRFSALAAALLPLPLLLLLALIWHRHADGEANPIDRALSSIAGLMELFALARKSPTSLPFFDLTIAVLVVLFALAIFGFMLAIALADRLMGWRAEPADASAGAGLGAGGALADEPADPRTEPDPRLAIIRAWGRFERALAHTRAARAPWQTPAEFMRAALALVPLPAPPVQRLTALFELARFSRRPLDTDTRDAACDCLDEITAALAEEAARGR